MKKLIITLLMIFIGLIVSAQSSFFWIKTDSINDLQGNTPIVLSNGVVNIPTLTVDSILKLPNIPAAASKDSLLAIDDDSVYKIPASAISTSDTTWSYTSKTITKNQYADSLVPPHKIIINNAYDGKRPELNMQYNYGGSNWRGGIISVTGGNQFSIQATGGTPLLLQGSTFGVNGGMLGNLIQPYNGVAYYISLFTNNVIYPALSFHNGSSSFGQISQGGWVIGNGLGTLNPTHRLQVMGDGYFDENLTANDTLFFTDHSGVRSGYLYKGLLNIGNGTNAPYVGGNFYQVLIGTDNSNFLGSGFLFGDDNASNGIYNMVIGSHNSSTGDYSLTGGNLTTNANSNYSILWGNSVYTSKHYVAGFGHETRIINNGGLFTSGSSDAFVDGRSGIVPFQDNTTHSTSDWVSPMSGSLVIYVDNDDVTSATLLVVGSTANAAETWAYKIDAVYKKVGSAAVTILYEDVKTLQEDDVNFHVRLTPYNVTGYKIEFQDTGASGRTVYWSITIVENSLVGM